MLVIDRKYGFRTTNFYGAQVLNSWHVMFVDVDLGYGMQNLPDIEKVEFQIADSIVRDTERIGKESPKRWFFGQAIVKCQDAATGVEYEIFAWAKSEVSQEDADRKALVEATAADPHTSHPLALVEERFGGLLRGSDDAALCERTPLAPPATSDTSASTTRGATTGGKRATHSLRLPGDKIDKAMNANGDRRRRKPGLMTRRQADRALKDFVATNPEFGFRVYATHSGLRYLCTSHLFDPSSRVVQKILTMLGSHIQYRFMCEDQGNFRARLTPKPWRNLGNDYAVCKFIKHVGTTAIDLMAREEVEHIIAYHDEQTFARSVKKLA